MAISSFFRHVNKEQKAAMKIIQRCKIIIIIPLCLAICLKVLTCFFICCMFVDIKDWLVFGNSKQDLIDTLTPLGAKFKRQHCGFNHSSE